VLDGADVSEQLRGTCKRVVADVVRTHTSGIPEEWDIETMVTELKTLYPSTVKVDDLADELPEQHELIELVQEDALAAYDAREEQLGADTMRELERQVLLTVLDRKWREHLYEMDYLREGIGLRAMAQRDPLVEYQREGGDMFNAMMEAFMEEVVADEPADREIHVILDNLNTHKKNDEWLAAHPNVTFHFTPTSASWLNQVEIWFGIFQRKTLRNASFSSVDQLVEAIQNFTAAYNQNAAPFVWRKREVKGAQLRNTIVNLCN